MGGFLFKLGFKCEKVKKTLNHQGLFVAHIKRLLGL